MRSQAEGGVSPGIRRGICAVHVGIITALSLMPAWVFPPSPAGIPGIDKVVHMAMYGVLGILLRWSSTGRAHLLKGWGWPVAGAAYGLFMEFCQVWLSGWGRGFSWGDALANLVGVGGFWLLAGLVLLARPHNNN